jgi:hypothetical protein
VVSGEQPSDRICRKIEIRFLIREGPLRIVLVVNLDKIEFSFDITIVLRFSDRWSEGSGSCHLSCGSSPVVTGI